MELKEDGKLDNIEINEGDFIRGLRKGIPIALGYLSVSLTFGMIASRGGISTSMAVLISMTNLTSAGQFAGIEMILAGSSYMEIALTILVINIRYMLMSLSISQKLKDNFSINKKCLIAFGITDETYTISALENGKLSFEYMIGLISLPYFSWALGTFIGAVSTSFMPESLQDSLGIALYAMFIALIVPASKKSRMVFLVVIISIILSCMFKYLPLLNNISTGFTVIITSISAAAIGAKLFPIKEES